ncbi:MAG: hypothetical protein NE330_00505 [Lentisphaeraceae bacterium]|nr:hypothetical protein [Lentisphaeraceae bacterium]
MTIKNESPIKSDDSQSMKFIENVVHDLKSTDGENPFKDLETPDSKSKIHRTTT